MQYNEKCDRANAQDKGRAALWSYARIRRRNCGASPALEFGWGDACAAVQFLLARPAFFVGNSGAINFLPEKYL